MRTNSALDVCTFRCERKNGFYKNNLNEFKSCDDKDMHEQRRRVIQSITKSEGGDFRMCAPVDWTILPVPFESYTKDVFETADVTLENRVPFMVCANVIVGKPLTEADIVGTG